MTTTYTRPGDRRRSIFPEQYVRSNVWCAPASPRISAISTRSHILRPIRISMGRIERSALQRQDRTSTNSQCPHGPATWPQPRVQRSSFACSGFRADVICHRSPKNTHSQRVLAAPCALIGNTDCNQAFSGSRAFLWPPARSHIRPPMRTRPDPRLQPVSNTMLLGVSTPDTAGHYRFFRAKNFGFKLALESASQQDISGNATERLGVCVAMGSRALARS